MDFHSVLQANGLLVDHVISDGRFHRCRTVDHPRKKNGFYKVALDGRAGFYGNFALTGEETFVWKPTDEQMALIPQIDPKVIEARRAEERRVAMNAMSEMRHYWNSLSPMDGPTEYLKRKQLDVLGCDKVRVDGESMVIPMYRKDVLVNIQRVWPNGKKRFWKDAPSKGCLHKLVRPRSVVTVLAEGFATGLALFQAVPQASVIVCFSAHNMIEVAQSLDLTGMVVVAADNDHETAKNFLARTGVATNPGVEAGEKAARIIGCGCAYPEDIEGTDWSDALVEWNSPIRVRHEVLKKAKAVFK